MELLEVLAKDPDEESRMEETKVWNCFSLYRGFKDGWMDGWS